MTTIYGIPNCDTMKKARAWLSDHNIEAEFHDYRKQGVDENFLAEVASQVGWEVLLNKRGTTFRQLSDADKADIDLDKALKLMTAHPAMIKRPVLAHNGSYTVGFNAADYEALFSA